MSRSKSKRPKPSAAQARESAPSAPAPTAEPRTAPPESAAPERSADPGAPAQRMEHPVLTEARGGRVGASLRMWLAAYRVEVVLFLVSFAVLASFSSQRFPRQSEAPHFVYQAKAWLEGRLDL